MKIVATIRVDYIDGVHDAKTLAEYHKVPFTIWGRSHKVYEARYVALAHGADPKEHLPGEGVVWPAATVEPDGKVVILEGIHGGEDEL